jgi:hypothetical protein
MLIWCDRSVRKTTFVPFLPIFLENVKVKVKHSIYRPGEALTVPGD